MQIQARTIADGNPFERSERAFAAVTRRLARRETFEMTHGDLERLLEKDGPELIRQLLQDHVDLRGPGEVRGDLFGARDVARPHARERQRKLETIFGGVAVSRKGYSAHGAKALSS